VSAVAQTNEVFAVWEGGFPWVLKALKAYAKDVTVVVSITAKRVGPEGILVAPATIAEAVDTAHLAIAAAKYRAASTIVEKAAATDQAYTAAHVVTALKFGIVLFQVDAAGTYSTKVPAATPTTAMAFDTDALALAALPVADAGKTAFAYAIYEADAGNWVANTDDHSTDLTAFTVTILDAAQDLVTAALEFVAGKLVSAELEEFATLRAARTEALVLMYTSDGDGALTNGFVEAVLRAYGLNGESGIISRTDL
jgi:hypothetical protein